jgi:hypothetical protein
MEVHVLLAQMLSWYMKIQVLLPVMLSWHVWRYTSLPAHMLSLHMAVHCLLAAMLR